MKDPQIKQNQHLNQVQNMLYDVCGVCYMLSEIKDSAKQMYQKYRQYEC